MNKKTILFFSRCELVDLYGKLHKHLSEDFNIVHIAYSEIEANILKTTYNIEGITIFKNEFLIHQNNLKVDQLFFNELDEIFEKETSGRFNLNGSIQSDRTFKKINYTGALNITAIYYNTWKNIFDKQKINFFIHEPTSLMLNHMASILCKKQGGIYSTHIMIQGESDYNFIMVDHDNGFPTELKAIFNQITDAEIKTEYKRIQLFLENFRSSYKVFFDIIGSNKPNYKLYFQLLKSGTREQLSKWFSFKKTNRFSDTIENFLSNNQLNTRRLKNLINYQKIKYDTYDPNLDFYFYPFHLEPEAVVLYWADGIYTNQVKLIENIASQLPPNVFLYVKDHPHLYGYRNIEDYIRLQEIPNIKLLPPYLPGKKIVNESKGVITLNGTAGFEALLLNKQVITFGSAFYSISKRVAFIDNIKDFKKVIYNIDKAKYNDDEELYKFVLAYLKCHKIGFTDFYGNVANNIKIDMDDNIKNVAIGLTSFFNNYDEFVLENND